MKKFKCFARKQAGVGLGYLLMLIVIVAAIGAASMKFGSDSTPSTSAQTARLDAGTIGNQIGTARGNLTVLATATTNAWNNFGVNSTGGNMTLGTAASGTSAVADAALDTNRRAPVPPRGATGPMEWRYTTPTANGNLYMYTRQADVPNATCTQFNQIARGTAAEIVNATIHGAIATEVETTGVVAYDTATAWDTAVDTATATGDGCFIGATGGSGRIVARLR